MKKWFFNIVVFILLFVGITVWLNFPNLGDPIPGNPAHHLTHGFQNPPGSPEKKVSLDTIKFLWSRITHSDDLTKIPEGHVVNSEKALADFEAMQGSDSITWIGHMTAVLRMQNKMILIDPWFTDYTTPVPPLGPKRVTPPGIELENLPQVDFVVISHNHYDHLDLPTLEQLPNPEKIIVIVPLKVAQYFSHIPFKEVIELDWYDTFEHDAFKFTALPVVHWSKRTLFDTNKTLWAGFSIESPQGKKVFYGEGDYGEVYRDVGEKMGGFDLALIANGAYLPRGVMQGSHCVPDMCVEMGLDLQAKNLVPLHWGTVSLGAEPMFEPGALFAKAAPEKGVDSRHVWIMRIGETRPF